MSINTLKKILVIEDDPDIADIMDIALSGKYQVRVKMDGHHLISHIRNFQPDLIVLDNFVGQKNAHDIISEMRTEDELQNIPFVLFSGHEDIKKIAQNINATAYLPKPFALDDLYRCINNILAA